MNAADEDKSYAVCHIMGGKATDHGTIRYRLGRLACRVIAVSAAF